MNLITVLSHYFHPGSIQKQTVPEDPAIRLLPRTPLDELPPYREHMAILAGERRGRALDPLWTHPQRQVNFPERPSLLIRDAPVHISASAAAK